MKYLGLILILTKLAFAAEAELPKIIGHTALELTAIQGDRVLLKIETKDLDDDVQWWIDSVKLCSAAKCTLSTSSLKTGKHKLFAIISNDKGSQFLNYSLFVKERLDNSTPQIIRPKYLVIGVEAHMVYQDGDPYAVSHSGTAFAWQDKELYLLKKVPRRLMWIEKLKSSGSTLQFGVNGIEEHFLLPGSAAELYQYEGRRVINLKRGSLRSRQLSFSKDPQWSILVADWLQLEGFDRSDIAVDYSLNKPNLVTLSIYSGQLQATHKVNGEVHQHQYPSGVKVVIFNGKKASITKVLSRKRTKKIIHQTSKELLGSWSFDGLRVMPATYSGLQVKDYAPFIKKQIQSGNFSFALGILRTTPKKFRESHAGLALRGEALAGMNLAKEALKHLREAYQELRDPYLAYLIGNIYFENYNWDKAEEWLILAADYGVLPDKQVLYYYLGIIAFSKKDFELAERYFQRSNKNPNQQEIVTSIEKFRDKMLIVDDWVAEGRMRLLIDSNLFQTSSKANLSFQDRVSGLSGYGYEFYGDIWYHLLQSESASWSIGYQGVRLGWIKKALHDMDRIDQLFYSRLFFGSRRQFQFDSYLRTIVLGQERALDGLGLALKLDYQHWFLSPHIGMELGVTKDPLPGQVDLVDVLSGDLQGSASDRSSRTLELDLGFSLYDTDDKEVALGINSFIRSFTSPTTQDESYQQQTLSLAYIYKFWGLSQIESKISLAQTEAPAGDDPRSDSTQKAEFTYLYDMEHDGNFHIGLSHASRASNTSEYVYSKYVFSAGIQFYL